ncbi:MAG: hypothetical protein ABSH10_07035 [Phycisphaerae bacterium]
MTFFARRPLPQSIRAVMVGLVWASAFFVLGYASLTLGHDPRISTIVLAAAIIPFGATAASVPHGLLRGLGLGVADGVGMAWGMLLSKGKIAPPDQMDRLVLTWFLAAAFLATAVASLFAIFAQRRRRMTY